VAVGAETARLDRPRLDLRFWEAGGILPRPVVFDTDPPRCPVDLDWEGREPLILVPEGAAARAAAHAARGWRVLSLPADAEGRVVLEVALPVLLGEGLSSLLVEGGGRLLSAFLRSGLWERWELVVAPTLFADDGRPFWSGSVEMAGLRVADVARRGADVQLTLFPAEDGLAAASPAREA
jgi:diaminohydroxyphosphoribosylaminopyrimidine deaminase/5-amino-6-(5-phosphoribosylamino)uracil reductase